MEAIGPRVIVVSGRLGCGKTTLCNLLKRELRARCVYVNYGALREFHMQAEATAKAEAAERDNVMWSIFCSLVRTYINSGVQCVIVDDLQDDLVGAVSAAFVDVHVTLITLYRSDDQLVSDQFTHTCADSDYSAQQRTDGESDQQPQHAQLLLLDYTDATPQQLLQQTVDVLSANPTAALPRRQGSFSVKQELYPYGDDCHVHAWVADMDFRPPEFIQRALVNRFQQCSPLGYTYQPRSMWEAVCSHLAMSYDWTVDPACLRYSPSVITSAFLAIQTFTGEGDAIAAFTPLYTPLLEVVESTNRNLIKISLEFNEGTYQINFEQFEAALRANNVHMFILCNPHNPGGHVWKAEELARLESICAMLNVMIMSDEIHCELVLCPKETPFTPLGKIVAAAALKTTGSNLSKYIALMAPTKTFNLAGLKSSFIVIPDGQLRAQYDNATASSHVQYGGVVATTVFPLCYSELGRQYTWQLRIQIARNVHLLKSLLESENIGLTVFEPKASFLVWVQGTPDIMNWFVKQAKVAVSPGYSFGDDRQVFKRMVRINVATSEMRIREMAGMIVAHRVN